MTDTKIVITDKMTPIGLPALEPLDPEVLTVRTVTEVKFWRKLGSLFEAARYTLYVVAAVKPVKLYASLAPG